MLEITVDGITYNRVVPVQGWDLYVLIQHGMPTAEITAIRGEDYSRLKKEQRV